MPRIDVTSIHPEFGARVTGLDLNRDLNGDDEVVRQRPFDRYNIDRRNRLRQVAPSDLGAECLG